MRNRTARGFTLVELLVSLAILSVALGVLFGAISNSLDRVRKGRDEALAASLVQSLIARAGTEHPLAPGESTGAFSNAYRWRIVVRSAGDADDVKARHAVAYRVRATVSWRDGGQDHVRALSALRIVPLPPKQP